MQITLTKKQKAKVAQEILHDVYKTITEKDVLRIEGKTWYIGDKILPDAERDAIVADANAISSTFLYPLLMREMRVAAQKKMFETSTSWDEMLFGKACLYIVDIIEKKIDTLTKLGR